MACLQNESRRSLARTRPPHLFLIAAASLTQIDAPYITPADRNGCACRLLPCSVRPSPFASWVGIRGSATSRDTEIITRPAQASRVLRPAGSLGSPRRPLSRGFDVASYPPTPPASFQVNRQLPLWNLPPLTLHAFEARYHVDRTSISFDFFRRASSLNRCHG